MEVPVIPYKNLSGNSGVVEYDSGTDYIKIRFQSGRTIYIYDYAAPGQTHVEQMKILAHAGRGLLTYINQNVRKNYSRTE